MILKETRKLKSIIKIDTSILSVFLFFILFFISFAGHSQNYKFKFNKSTVSKALSEVASEMHIKISFDAGALEKYTITKTISGTDPKEIIVQILAGTYYTVQYKYETYLLMKPARIQQRKAKEKIFSGIVFDKESGERLPYSTIYEWDNNLSVSTTVDGTFSLQLKDSSNVVLLIKYLGYYSLDTVINTSLPINFIEIGLQKRTQSIETVNVTGEKLKMVALSNEAGHFSFNPSRFSDLPNYGETDIFRALQLIPGISSIENSSQLNIRGSSADQNLVLFDGFTLYNLDHFFGVFSALNPNVIKNIQVYRGGFDSRYGERVSGIVDITGKSGNQQKPEVYGGVNLISGNLTVELPVSKKLTLIAAGRRAYSDIYSSWLTDEILSSKVSPPPSSFDTTTNVIEPNYYFSDYNLKLTFTPNQKENFSFSLYGARDYLNSSNITEIRDTIINTDDINKWGNYGLGISWNRQWSPSYFSSFHMGHSGYFNDYSNNTIAVDPDSTNVEELVTELVTNETNDLTDYFATFQNKYNLNTKNQFEFGTSVKFNRFKYYKDATREYIYNNLDNSALLYTLYFQDRYLHGKFQMKPGFRINYYNKTDKLYFEPRITASYQINDGTVLKFASGRYYQFLNKQASEQTYGYNRDFWVLADSRSHPVVSSNHFIAGISYETQRLFFDLEAYYKTVKGLQEYLFVINPGREQDDNPSENTPLLSQFISGDGKAYGFDFLAKYESANFSSWLAYSLSKSTQHFAEINDGASIPAKYDQTHEIKWTNIYSYQKWNFSTLTLFNTGRPYIKTEIRNDDFSRIREYSRLPDYFRIDLSANYNFNLKKVNIKPGVSILNALNIQNYLDIYTRNIGFGGNNRRETTLIKAQDLTFNFFVNFRF